MLSGRDFVHSSLLAAAGALPDPERHRRDPPRTRSSRPAHGAGMDGHQQPYLSLGDATVLAEGMMFSNEPGLDDPAGGVRLQPLEQPADHEGAGGAMSGIGLAGWPAAI